MPVRFHLSHASLEVCACHFHDHIVICVFCQISELEFLYNSILYHKRKSKPIIHLN